MDRDLARLPHDIARLRREMWMQLLADLVSFVKDLHLLAGRSGAIRPHDRGGAIAPAGSDLPERMEAMRSRTCRVRVRDELFEAAQAPLEAIDDVAAELAGHRDYFRSKRHGMG